MSWAIADTSFVVALANQNDRYHRACDEIRRREEIIILPQSVLAEVGYMLRREIGNQGVIHFLRSLHLTKYRPLPLEQRDLLRVADILEQYADSRIDFVDATVAAVAERLEITRILTLDRRDFQILRPAHSHHFEILPL